MSPSRCKLEISYDSVRICKHHRVIINKISLVFKFSIREKQDVSEIGLFGCMSVFDG